MIYIGGKYLTNDRGLQVYKDGSGDVLARAGLGEEGGEGVVPHGLVGGHLAVGLDAVLQAVQLPAGVAHLDAGLADVDGDALAHGDGGGGGVGVETGESEKISRTSC